jgi:ubiquinone/menaquinone biosynthesis C-methylase UbiE
MNGKSGHPESFPEPKSPNPMNPLASPDPWTLVAEGYQESTRLYLELFSRSGLEWVDFDSNTEVVDVACGPGTTSLLLAPRVKRVACVDFSEGMIAQLRRNLTEAGVTNVDCVQADGQALPFGDGSFDLGVSMFGLMFFPSRPKGFAELHRVLRPGGQVLVSSWAPVEKSSAMQALFGALRAADPTRPAPQTDITSLENPEVFERELRDAGFQDVRVEAVEHGLEAPSVEAFWQEIVRGAAPMALLRRKLGEPEWARQEQVALDHLRRTLGDSPPRLSSTAYVAVARR